MTRVDEDSDDRRNFLPVDQVVQDNGGAVFTCFINISMTILKNHYSCRLRGVILCGNVDVIVSNGSLKDSAGPRMLRNLSLRNTCDGV